MPRLRALAAVLSFVGGAALVAVSPSPAFAAAPTITSFAPTSGPIGTTVTITGSGYASPATVTFGGVASKKVQVSSATKLTAVVPPGAGTGTITVSDANGSVTSGGTFAVTPGLTLSPPSGPPTTATTVSVGGFGASEAVDVYVDTTDVALASASSRGAATLTVTVPANETAGQHWITAVGRHSGISAQRAFLVRTNWAELGLGPAHRGANPYENQLTTSTVGGLSQSWRTAQIGGQISEPAVVGGVVYVGFADGAVKALDETTGAVRWTFTTGAEVLSSPAVSGGVVYVGSDDGYLYAIDATTGTQRWRAVTSGVVRSSPAVAGGVVYVGSFDDDLYAFDASTGAKRWVYPTGQAVFSSPAVAGGVVYVGSNDANVYAVDATSGTLDWSFATGSRVVASPVVADGRVYVGSEDGSFYALRASTGAEMWVTKTGAEIEGDAAVAGGVVYVGSDDGVAYALRETSGSVVWTSTPSGRILQAGTTVADGVVYVGDGTDTYALDASYGGLVRAVPSSAPYSAAVPVNGALLVADFDDGVIVRYTLDPGNATTTSTRPVPAALHPDPRLRS